MSVTTSGFPFLFAPFEQLEALIDLKTLRCVQCDTARDLYGEPRFYIHADITGALWVWCHTCLFEREPMSISVPGRFPDGSTLVLLADVDSTTMYDRRRIGLG
jgi:hypothetical protein